MRCSELTSASRGTLSSTSVWSVSRLAIINGKVAFLAPEIGIDPTSLWPPLMRMRSMPPPRLPPRVKERRAAALAALLIGANSGRIVGFCGGLAAAGRGAALGLRLAPLEILPQGRAQAAMPPGLFHALGRLGLLILGPSVHGPRLRPPASASKGCDTTRSAVLAPPAPLWQGSPRFFGRRTSCFFASGPRCRS